MKVYAGNAKLASKLAHFSRTKTNLKIIEKAVRGYIIQLGLDAPVCGKCIKARYRNSIFSNRFKLSR